RVDEQMRRLDRARQAWAHVYINQDRNGDRLYVIGKLSHLDGLTIDQDTEVLTLELRNKPSISSAYCRVDRNGMHLAPKGSRRRRGRRKLRPGEDGNTGPSGDIHDCVQASGRRLARSPRGLSQP